MKPFVDDLLLGRDFVRSRVAPSMRLIESQPFTQGFEEEKKKGKQHQQQQQQNPKSFKKTFAQIIGSLF